MRVSRRRSSPRAWATMRPVDCDPMSGSPGAGDDAGRHPVPAMAPVSDAVGLTDGREARTVVAGRVARPIESERCLARPVRDDGAVLADPHPIAQAHALGPALPVVVAPCRAPRVVILRPFRIRGIVRWVEEWNAPFGADA